MIRQLTIPRYTMGEEVFNIQIHGFLDASGRAYGACVYIRTTSSQDQITTRLLCSKSRVAPLKSIALPRLELCGALLLAQLTSKVLKSLRIPIRQIYYWTDSVIVLHWVKATDKTWNTFVAHGIGEIQRLSQPNNWYHVSTETNPADHVSRGVLPSKLSNSIFWWSGPPFI